jgi:hypothetical protein
MCENSGTPATLNDFQAASGRVTLTNGEPALSGQVCLFVLFIANEFHLFLLSDFFFNVFSIFFFAAPAAVFC